MARKLIEVAYVVEDMDKAIDHWMRVHKVGPWYRAIFEMPDVDYRGTRFDLRVDVGFAMSNGIMIELMEQLDGHPSFFSETGPGYNHMMYAIEDRDTEVARYRGLGKKFGADGTLYMMDATEHTGGFVEIASYEGFISRMYDGLKAANDAWDGKPAPVGDLFALVG